MNDVTLQINLSPGDVNYAKLTVPALVNKHLNIKNRLLLIDCCRPQKTKLIDPEIKFPLEKFEANVKIITSIAEDLLSKNIVSDIYYLYPGDPLINQLAKKYLRNIYNSTHGAGGTANIAYWAGIELPDTRYVLHYDGDMMLYQSSYFDWVAEAKAGIASNKKAVIALPRSGPPINIDLPTVHEGRPFKSIDKFWVNDWFSTRCFFIDKLRLNNHFPLLREKLIVELYLRKFMKRAFPLDPEIILHRAVGLKGGERLMLKSADSWTLHPIDKSALFLKILPQVLSNVEEGNYPSAQAGYENLDLQAWKNFLCIE